MPRKTYEQLRSARWFAPDDFRSFGHRSRTMQMGFGPEDWEGKPVVAIINTWSDINPCHQHFRQRAEDVRRGILQAGGFPVEMPALSLSENFVKPTTMLYRNLLAMETEELLRSHPVDGAVLMGGCDKTTPGLIMGAVSAGYPFIYPAGRADAARQLQGRGAGLRVGRVQILGRAPRRHDQQGAMGRRRSRHRPLLRPLHDHGHGFDHDRHRRSAGADAARRLIDPGRRFQPHPHEHGLRASHRRDDLGGFDARPDPHCEGRRQRRHRGHGDRLLDQCRDPSCRHGAPGGRVAVA